MPTISHKQINLFLNLNVILFLKRVNIFWNANIFKFWTMFLKSQTSWEPKTFFEKRNKFERENNILNYEHFFGNANIYFKQEQKITTGIFLKLRTFFQKHKHWVIFLRSLKHKFWVDFLTYNFFHKRKNNNGNEQILNLPNIFWKYELFLIYEKK